MIEPAVVPDPSEPSTRTATEVAALASPEIRQITIEKRTCASDKENMRGGERYRERMRERVCVCT